MAHKSRKVPSKHQRDDYRQDDSEGSGASDQCNLQQSKRSRLFHGQDPSPVDQIPAMTNKIRTWDESEIRRLVLRAVEPPFLCASAIHPTASILADCISVPRVPLSIFKITCPLLRSDPRASAWKCGFFCRQTSAHATASRSKRGRLVITKPSRIHEAFVTFGTIICDQLYNSGFLPTRYKRNEILQTGSASESRPHRTLTGKQVIDRLPVFPSSLSVPNQTFDIGWADIKRGTWSDFCKNTRLPDSTPPPVCAINFASLVLIAGRLAGQINDSRENTPLYRPEDEADTPVS